ASGSAFPAEAAEPLSFFTSLLVVPPQALTASAREVTAARAAQVRRIDDVRMAGVLYGEKRGGLRGGARGDGAGARAGGGGEPVTRSRNRRRVRRGSRDGPAPRLRDGDLPPDTRAEHGDDEQHTGDDDLRLCGDVT